jgi:hypothetical protein
MWTDFDFELNLQYRDPRSQCSGLFDPALQWTFKVEQITIKSTLVR